MIEQNIQAKVSPDLDNKTIKSIMAFFNNVEGSIQNDDNLITNEGAIIINGEQYNEMIIRTICDCIKDMLEKEESTKQMVSIILNRFDYMLKEFIDIMQNNGILKIILLRIIDKFPFIFVAIQIGIENAINKRIELVSKTKAIGEAYITETDISGDYAFFKSIISSIIDELTDKLELISPSDENPNDSSDTLTGGNTRQHLKIYNPNKTSYKYPPTYKTPNKKTIKKSKKGGGWFW
jgi:hypothetical protein